MTRRITTFVALCLLSASSLFTATGNAKADPCDAETETRVTGATECLVYQSFGTQSSNTTLVVFIHGDGSRGGASDYLYPLAQSVSGDGVVTVGLIRPGYYSEDGKSTGSSYRKNGDGYRPHIVDAVTGAVLNLKTRFEAKRVILVGHSGGAALSGVILGRAPGLVDAAVLGACPCHVSKWRLQRRGKDNWRQSLSPHDFVDGVPKDTVVIALTGEADDNTRSNIAEGYVEDLQEAGIAARFAEVADAGHNRVMRMPQMKDAIVELINTVQ